MVMKESAEPCDMCTVMWEAQCALDIQGHAQPMVSDHTTRNTNGMCPLLATVGELCQRRGYMHTHTHTQLLPRDKNHACTMQCI